MTTCIKHAVRCVCLGLHLTLHQHFFILFFSSASWFINRIINLFYPSEKNWFSWWYKSKNANLFTITCITLECDGRARVQQTLLLQARDKRSRAQEFVVERLVFVHLSSASFFSERAGARFVRVHSSVMLNFPRAAICREFANNYCMPGAKLNSLKQAENLTRTNRNVMEYRAAHKKQHLKTSSFYQAKLQ